MLYFRQKRSAYASAPAFKIGKKAFTRFLKQFEIQLQNKKKHFSLAFIHGPHYSTHPPFALVCLAYFSAVFLFLFSFILFLNPKLLCTPPSWQLFKLLSKCATFSSVFRWQSAQNGARWKLQLSSISFVADSNVWTEKKHKHNLKVTRIKYAQTHEKDNVNSNLNLLSFVCQSYDNNQKGNLTGEREARMGSRMETSRRHINGIAPVTSLINSVLIQRECD